MIVKMHADADLVRAFHAALAKVEQIPAAPLNPSERVLWAEALFDGGDEESAATALMPLLDECLPDEFPAAAERILTGARGEAFALAALDGDHAYENHSHYSWQYMLDSGVSYPTPAGTIAGLTAGNRNAEDALLRKVSAHPENGVPTRPDRAGRIGSVVAALAEIHRDEPAYLDHLAVLLGGQDRARLASAAALLGPLGLDETLRRCGTIEDHAGPALVAAFAAADRFDDALAVAGRLGADARQDALLSVAAPDLPAARAKALVAAFRKSPKSSRSRDDSTAYRHRFARLLLTLDLVDEALAELARMRNYNGVEYGPEVLVREVFRRFELWPQEATPARLRIMLDVLAGPGIHPNHLARMIAGRIRLIYQLGDASVRADLVATDVPCLRARFWGSSRMLPDAGLAWARVLAGDRTAADALCSLAADTETDWEVFGAMIPIALAAGLPNREPEVFTRLVAAAFSRAPGQVDLTRFDADALRLVPDALCRAPVGASWAGYVVANESDDRQLLAAALEMAPNMIDLHFVGRRVAVTLARSGNMAAAVEIAEFCGLAQ